MELDYFKLVRRSQGLDSSKLSESLRVAIVGDAASQQLATVLKPLFHDCGIRVSVYEGPIDGTELQVYDPSSEFYRFDPEVVIVLSSVQALKTRYYKRPGSGADFAKAEGDKLASVWEAIRKNKPIPIIQSNFAYPVERMFGNFDHKVEGSLHSVVMALNSRLAEEARSRNTLFINDVEAISGDVGRSAFFDNRFWNMYKAFCNLEHLPLVAKNIVDVALSIRGRAVKCVILDLDNTLWGGIIGDDGVNGIELAAHGDGECFYDFQCFLLELQRRGILLAVCSKNSPENALKPFQEHPDMVLKREHITAFVANWENKADNIRKIQAALNIGFDSMVFLDDNPFERNLVKSLVPGVIVPELPEEPADYVKAVCALNLFETSSFSAEDAQRTEMYRQRAEAAETATAFGSVDDYLKSLEMKINVGRFEKSRLGRIAQLFMRSNQFNLTTQRRTEPECEALVTDPLAYPIFADLADKHGDHGLISLVIARKNGDTPDAMHLSDWLMSCRVLTRGVEHFLMNHCVEYAKKLGKKFVTAEYRPSAKNAMVKEFYGLFGFEKTGEAADGTTSWRLVIDDYRPTAVHLAVVGLPDGAGAPAES